MKSPRRRFILCIERFNHPTGRVWTVRWCGRWLLARMVQVNVPMETVFLGMHAPQPKAYLTGVGRLTRLPDAVLQINP